MQNEHHLDIEKIIEREFGQQVESIERMGNGICNEVYRVRAGELDCVVRLKAEGRYMYGSHNHIPIFRAAGIDVPEILAENYSPEWSPFAYQVLSVIPGRDINDVISTLSDDELKGIASHVSRVFDALEAVPNNGKFGVLWGDGDDLVDSWAAEIARMTKVAIGWGTRTGVLDAELAGILEWINAEYKPYFESVRPVTYFGDICAKNVMVDRGEFAGLVDLDALAQGDPCEAIGRIKASWYGTHYGRVYSDAVMDEQHLDPDRRRIVTMYALLNRTFWTMENGIRFNQNTEARVDPVRERQDKAAVRALHKELLEIEASKA
jgi:aminoglycoside phosphotransferase (APT) family kinase protein